MSKKKRDKYGIHMYSFFISPNPKKDLKLSEKLQSIKEASKREEVHFRLN